MAKSIVLYEDDCIGCRACVDICPEVFGFLEGVGKALVINPDGGDESDILESIAMCPVSCIAFEDE